MSQASERTSTPESYQTHLFSYFHEGARWAFSIPASSPEDARDRLRKLATADYDGVLVARIDVPAGDFLLRLWNWIFRRPK